MERRKGMREIKFRAWDPEDSRMLPGTDIYGFGADDYGPSLGGKYLDWNYGRLELMQYTGLKDKNGVEIYEGDIVAWNTGEKFVVRWFAPHAKFLYRCIKKGYGIDNDAGSHEVEVIGNIYENPELLEKNNAQES